MNNVYRVRIFVLNMIIAISVILVGCSTLPSRQPQLTPINNFDVVEEGVIFRGGQPKYTDWRYLKALGVKTVIRLNKFPEEYSMEQEKIDAAQYDIKVLLLPSQPEDWPKNWKFWAAPEQKDLETVEKVITGAKIGSAVYIHCSHGKDRTGLVVALWRVNHSGWCTENAYDEMLGHGYNPLLFGLKNKLYSSSAGGGCRATNGNADVKSY